jgi:glycosyltransferase involved in cell wall biosynthesis
MPTKTRSNKSKEKNVLVFVHRIYKKGVVKKGGADYIIDYLSKKNFDTYLVEHPLDGVGPTHFGAGKLVKKFLLFGSGPVRWVQEIAFNTFLFLFSFSLKKRKCDLVLAVDPLNFIAGDIIRSFSGVKVHFHSVDYSEHRFESPLLNKIYNFIYNFAVRNADIVTYVSKPMKSKLEKLGSERLGSILFHLPNSPEFKLMPRVPAGKREPGSVVYSKAFISDSEIKMLLEEFSVVAKKYPGAVLHLVGDVSENSQGLLKESSLSENIKLHGLVSYEENLEIVSKCLVGLGWYENKLSFEKYADSLKIREYAALGLPSICNDGISTAYEMEEEGAGIMVGKGKSLSEALLLLFSNTKVYKSTSKNALKWARSMDKVDLLNDLYSQAKLL